MMPACIVPDYCIELYTPGVDWCAVLDGAMIWPNDQPELAEPLVDEYGGPPKGCVCFNDADQAILGDGTPAEQYDALSAIIGSSARNACNALVPLGYDSNCFVKDGEGAAVAQSIFASGPSNDCKGKCVFTNPPPFGDCPEKNPYECNDDEHGNDEVDEPADVDSGGSESGTGVGEPVDQRIPVL